MRATRRGSGVAQRLAAELRGVGCVHAEEEAEAVLAEIRRRGLRPGTAAGDAALRDYLERRRAGEPAEHVLGWARLAGVRVAVGPGVFIPRPWTAALVRRAAAILRRRRAPAVVDLGTGSGAIALAIQARVPAARVWATEADPTAAGWAERNCATIPEIQVCRGDLYDPLPETLAGGVDVVAGSLPYVPATALEALPRDHLGREPGLAFDGGEGGLEVVGRAIAGAPRWLGRRGHLLLEIGHGQGEAAAAMASAAGLAWPRVHRDAEGGELFIEAEAPIAP
jgi:release factor glutamine methyltransferase